MEGLRKAVKNGQIREKNNEGGSEVKPQIPKTNSSP
jgi:hypothetical protein